jgi:CheY-like chemotaxis protein
MNPQPHANNRILIIDDNEDIHRDFRKILAPSGGSTTLAKLDELEAALLGQATSAAPPPLPSFELTSVFQGAEALERVQQALKDGTPYALAFIDMRMPPGWDGLETLAQLWQADPRLQAVLCSAYSDYSWEMLHARFGKTDCLLILKKPFDPVEVRQMTCALVEKWNRGTAHPRNELALRGGETTLHALLQVLPDALLRVGADGACLDFRPPQLAPSSTWPPFSPGSKLSEVLPEDAARRMLTRLHQALRDGTQQILEHAQPVAGQPRCFESRITALNATEALVLVRDITGR